MAKRAKQATQQFTSTRCANNCGNFLNTVQLFYGEKICTPCSTGVTVKKKYESIIKLADDDENFMELMSTTVNYVGKVFSIKLLFGKDNREHAVIKDDKGNIVYSNGEGTTEGECVFEYCKIEKIFKEKVL